MKIITAEIQRKLNKNFQNHNDKDVVLKLFNPCGSQTWLITQMEPDGDIMWGLCDLGMNCCEYGTVSLSELQAIRLPFGLTIERDKGFKGNTIEFYQNFYDTNGTLAGCH